MLSLPVGRQGSRSLPDFAIQAGMMNENFRLIEFTLRVPLQEGVLRTG